VVGKNRTPSKDQDTKHIEYSTQGGGTQPPTLYHIWKIVILKACFASRRTTQKENRHGHLVLKRLIPILHENCARITEEIIGIMTRPLKKDRMRILLEVNSPPKK